jgi:hypothetical protein
MQTFDYEQVSTKMEQLKVVFEDFAKRLDTMDKKYTEGIAVSSDSALYGSKADKVISHWNHLARSFSYFDKEFTELYELVQTVAKKNRAFEEEVAGIANSTSSDVGVVRGCGGTTVRGCGGSTVRGSGSYTTSSGGGGGSSRVPLNGGRVNSTVSYYAAE